MIRDLTAKFASGLLLAAAASSVGQSRQGDVVASLAKMRDRNRPLIVFFPSSEPGSPLQRQAKIVREHRRELEERDVAVVLAEDDAVNVRRRPSLDALRRRFHVDVGSFTVVLLGKDGEEKLRSRVPVTIERLDALIDAMPMRQQEIRDGRH